MAFPPAIFVEKTDGKPDRWASWGGVVVKLRSCHLFQVEYLVGTWSR